MMRKFGKLGSVGNRTQVQRAIAYLRLTGVSTALKVSAISGETITSTGPVTVSNGGSVEVLPNRTWRIV